MPKAEPVLKQTLGELTTEEFYNSPLRAPKAQQATELLNRDLGRVRHRGRPRPGALLPLHRRDPEEHRGEEAQGPAGLQEPGGGPRRDRGRQAQEDDPGRARRRWTSSCRRARAYITTKDAERDLYVRKKHAEADLLVKLAEAKKTQLRNDALQGAGSDRMVGLKMAEVMQGPRAPRPAERRRRRRQPARSRTDA